MRGFEEPPNESGRCACGTSDRRTTNQTPGHGPARGSDGAADSTACDRAPHDLPALVGFHVFNGQAAAFLDIAVCLSTTDTVEVIVGIEHGSLRTTSDQYEQDETTQKSC